MTTGTDASEGRPPRQATESLHTGEFVTASYGPGVMVDRRFRLVRLLGRGGTSELFEAENIATGGRVALKLLTAEARSQERLVRRFVQEARSLARVSHPNVVAVLDLGMDRAGVPYLVQELLRGEDLRRCLQRRGPLPFAEAMATLDPVLDALALVHRHHIVHRDVKPANIMLALLGTGITVPKLVDFGIARVRLEDRLEGEPTFTGVAVGTPFYMAPEQLRGDKGIDGRIDQWAAAATLYETFTAQVPFRTGSLPELFELIQHGAFKPVSAVRDDVPPGLDAVLARALHFDPAQRYPDMGAFSLALRALSPSAPAPLSAPPVLSSRPANERADEPTTDTRDPLPVSSLASPVPRTVVPTPRGSRLRAGLVATTGSVEGPLLDQAFDRALGLHCEVRRFRTYAQLVDALLDSEVDMAWLPPVAYVRARKSSGNVRLLLSVEREHGAHFASALLGHRETVGSLADTLNKRAVWVDRWSAAGYLLPRAMLRRAGFDPDRSFVSQGFVGSYSAALAAVRAGDAEVCASYCHLDARGELVRRPWGEEQDFTLLALSPPIPADTLCVRADLPETTVGWILAALSDLTRAAPLLTLFEARSFVRAEPSVYDTLEGVLRGEGLVLGGE